MGVVGVGDDMEGRPAVDRLPLYDPEAWEHAARRFGVPADAEWPEPQPAAVCSTDNLLREAGIPLDPAVDAAAGGVAGLGEPDRWEMPVGAPIPFGGPGHMPGDPMFAYGDATPDMFSGVAEPVAHDHHAGDGKGPLRRFPSGTHAREHSMFFRSRQAIELTPWLYKQGLGMQLEGRVDSATIAELEQALWHLSYGFVTLRGATHGAHHHASCAVVSLNDWVVGRNLDAEIDSHDAVFRIGADPVQGRESSVGTHTMVRVVDVDTMGLLLEHEEDTNDVDHIDTRGVWLFVPRADADVARFAEFVKAAKDPDVSFPLRTERIAIANPAWVEHVSANWTMRADGDAGRAASLEAIALQFALRTCTDQVELYGFGGEDSNAMYGVSKREAKFVHRSYYGAEIALLPGRRESYGERETRWLLHDSGIIVDRSRDDER
mmetsp:Transcript_7665/g.27278  ORF Transcript_7665/g.27278 Transcript_7665/m.27278 type:complete len:434 (-) Transcript_7665:63-1364(-)